MIVADLTDLADIRIDITRCAVPRCDVRTCAYSHVRVTHIPTGIDVVVMGGGHRTLQHALDVLRQTVAERRKEPCV